MTSNVRETHGAADRGAEVTYGIGVLGLKDQDQAAQSLQRALDLSRDC